jgi:hypothetical protein
LYLIQYLYNIHKTVFNTLNTFHNLGGPRPPFGPPGHFGPPGGGNGGPPPDLGVDLSGEVWVETPTEDGKHR